MSHRSSLALALLLCALPWSAGADGLAIPAGGLGGPGVGQGWGQGWQARLALDSTLPRSDAQAFALGPVASGLQTARLLGDYRLDTLRFGQTDGLRLTSGLLLNQRLGPLGTDTDARNAWPYLGLGLGLSGNGARGDWGFQADVGMASQSVGATVRLGRVLNGGLSVGDAWRELRLQPVVRLGMNYSF